MICTLVAAGTTIGASSASAESTWSEQVYSTGVGTFTDYHNASGVGPRIAPGAWVDVSCKVYDPYIASVNPDGYWYRIATAPWSDDYYSPANVFMNGDPWGGPYTHNTDWNVPDCGSVPAPPPPPAPTPSVSLSQGPAAPYGYRYAITLSNFSPDSSVGVQCYDNVSGDFFDFSMQTDGGGNAFTQSECYDADGPDHWVVADGVASNHVSWGAAPSTTPPSGVVAPGTDTTSSTPPLPDLLPQNTAKSVFYSPISHVATGLQGISPADENLPLEAWDPVKGACAMEPASDPLLVPPTVTTLAGWSLGRLGPIYFLATAGSARVSAIQNIVLFDPGSFANFSDPKNSCDWQVYPSINHLLANWLGSSKSHHLLVFTGHDSEDYEWEVPRTSVHGRADFSGLWHYYFADIWNKPFASQALVCDYDDMAHPDVLRLFAGAVKYPPAGCPVAPGHPGPVAWNP